MVVFNESNIYYNCRAFYHGIENAFAFNISNEIEIETEKESAFCYHHFTQDKRSPRNSLATVRIWGNVVSKTMFQSPQNSASWKGKRNVKKNGQTKHMWAHKMSRTRIWLAGVIRLVLLLNWNRYIDCYHLKNNFKKMVEIPKKILTHSPNYLSFSQWDDFASAATFLWNR